MVPLSCIPTHSTLQCRCPNCVCQPMETGRPSVPSHPMPRYPAKGHAELPVSLLDVRVAKLTSNESGVSPHKGCEYRETDSKQRKDRGRVEGKGG